MQKTKNFLNNQKYILGEKEKKKIIKKFFFLINMNSFLKYSYFIEKYFIIVFIIIILFGLIIAGIYIYVNNSGLYNIFIIGFSFFILLGICLIFIGNIKYFINNDIDYFDRFKINNYSTILNYFIDFKKTKILKNNLTINYRGSSYYDEKGILFYFIKFIIIFFIILGLFMFTQSIYDLNLGIFLLSIIILPFIISSLKIINIIFFPLLILVIFIKNMFLKFKKYDVYILLPKYKKLSILSKVINENRFKNKDLMIIKK